MIEITGLAGKLALVIPLIVLLLVMIRTMYGSRQAEASKRASVDDTAYGMVSAKTRRDEAEAAPRTPETPEPPQAERAPAPMRPTLVVSAPVFAPEADVARAAKAESAVQEAPAETPAEVAAERPSAPPVDWARRLAEAEAGADVVLLAETHLLYAQAELAGARLDVAAEQLRACLRVSARSRNKLMEAKARFELAELARASGDLTTACEHWQIARAIFHELASKPELADTEARMRTHGCPTDWVLNDF